MGPTSRLDLVEHYSAAGGPAAYDVSVHTPFRVDHKFVQKCAQTPGHAAEAGRDHKGSQQYKQRLPGTRLIPLTVETGGRWHVSIPPLVRCLAKEYLQRTPGLEDDALGAVVARWGARLSALLIRGNGAVVRAGGPPLAVSPHVDIIGNSGLHDLVPEGDCAYELLVS